jgi:hypothetical protein
VAANTTTAIHNKRRLSNKSVIVASHNKIVEPHTYHGPNRANPWSMYIVQHTEYIRGGVSQRLTNQIRSGAAVKFSYRSTIFRRKQNNAAENPPQNQRLFRVLLIVIDASWHRME